MTVELMTFNEAKNLLQGLRVAYNNPKILDLEMMISDFQELVYASHQVMKEFPTKGDSSYDINRLGGLSIEDQIAKRLKNTILLREVTERLIKRT